MNHRTATIKEPLDDLLGQYWDIAYKEGKTGKSFGDEANEVLCKIRQLVKPLQPITADDHQVALLVNSVTHIASAYHAHQSLRQRISNEIVPMFQRFIHKGAT